MLWGKWCIECTLQLLRYLCRDVLSAFPYLLTKERVHRLLYLGQIPGHTHVPEHTDGLREVFLSLVCFSPCPEETGVTHIATCLLRFGANLLLQPDRLAYGVLGQLQIMFSSLTSAAGLYGLRRGLRAGDAALDNAPRQSVHAEAAGGFAATVKAGDHLAP